MEYGSFVGFLWTSTDTLQNQNELFMHLYYWCTRENWIFDDLYSFTIEILVYIWVCQ